MEDAQNAENAADNLPVTAKLLDDEPESILVISSPLQDEEDQNAMDAINAIDGDEKSESHDDPVDVVGGDGEFAFVAKSGLPVTSPSDAEREKEKSEYDDPEIPSVVKKLSIINGGGAVSSKDIVFDKQVSVMRQGSVVLAKKHGLQGLSDKKKHILGICLIMVHCLTIVGSQQFAKMTYTKDFSAPFFLIYFRTVWRISVFPVFMVLKYVHRLIRRRREGPVSFMKTWTSCQIVFGPEGFTLKNFVYPCGLLSVLWVVVQFAHVFAVKFLNNSIVQALFCSETAFCYLLSALVLKVPVYALKVGAVLVALCGAGFMAYSQAGDDLRWEGIAICLSGAFLGSGYMVAVKKTIGKSEDVGQALLLTSAMSLFVTLTLWPVVLVLYYSGVEYWVLETFPWGIISLSSVLTLVSVAVFNLCLTLTSPLLMTLSKLMGIPVNYGIDSVYWNHKFDVYQIIGVLLIGVGFVFIALPERWLAISRITRRIRRQTSSAPPPPPTVTLSSPDVKNQIKS